MASQQSWKTEEEGTVGKGTGKRQVSEGPVPIQCLNNCGFFGSSATMNLCSKCYSNLNLSSSSTATISPTLSKTKIIECEASEKQIRKEKEEDEEEEEIRKRKKRCSWCNKKVGLTGFKCLCGHLFCGQHRYSDIHNCSFDYKAAGRLAIQMANPVVKAPKIQKI
eukprot:TRINITY_DN766_c0_g1_i1.p1 TRINITY_DN766_c0_g1~~TRINITY_DN766_c0_g1_i1.p1  ORF type:complete len:165 (+),score=23.54 TRINITY_DN766_c0_g1_i1:366-860(+)